MHNFLFKCITTLLSFTFLLLHQAQAQIEISAAGGPVISNVILHSYPDSVSDTQVNPELTPGFAFATEMSVPLQNRFRLKAGIRFAYKTGSVKQEYQLPQLAFRNYWEHRVYALETPVHITYLAIDRRWQVLIGAGLSAGKNWNSVKHIKGDDTFSGSNSGTIISTDYSFSTDSPVSKNSLLLAGECSLEIIPGFYSNFSLFFLVHQDFRKQFSKITYENTVFGPANNHPLLYKFNGTFEVSQPAYFTVQLRYTFRRKEQGSTEPKNYPEFEKDE